MMERYWHMFVMRCRDRRPLDVLVELLRFGHSCGGESVAIAPTKFRRTDARASDARAGFQDRRL
jgi:hypothetical protein